MIDEEEIEDKFDEDDKKIRVEDEDEEVGGGGRLVDRARLKTAELANVGSSSDDDEANTGDDWWAENHGATLGEIKLSGGRG